MKALIRTPRNRSQGLLLCALLALGLGSTARAVEPSLEGDWQLVEVAPEDMGGTDPRGVLNAKYRFSTDGRMAVCAPDQLFKAETPSVPYRVVDHRVMLGEGTRALTLAIDDHDPDRLRLSPQPTGAVRTLERLTGPDREREPLSLERVKMDPPVPPVAYATTDDTHAPLAQRVVGVWELQQVQLTGSAEPEGVPPYGFLNDLWILTPESLAVRARYAGQTVTVPHPLHGGELQVPLGTLFGEADARSVPMTVSFDRWGHMTVTAEGLRLTLKRVSPSTQSPPAVPIAIALLSLVAAPVSVSP